MSGCFENNITVENERELQIARAVMGGTVQRLKSSMERLRNTARARAYARSEMAYFAGRREWHISQLPFDAKTYPPNHPTLLWRQEGIIAATACIQICVEYLLTLED